MFVSVNFDAEFIEDIFMEQQKIYVINDSFHKSINGDDEPLVRSDQFDSLDDFFDWCRQHCADNKWREL